MGLFQSGYHRISGISGLRQGLDIMICPDLLIEAVDGQGGVFDQRGLDDRDLIMLGEISAAFGHDFGGKLIGADAEDGQTLTAAQAEAAAMEY